MINFKNKLFKAHSHRSYTGVFLSHNKAPHIGNLYPKIKK